MSFIQRKLILAYTWCYSNAKSKRAKIAKENWVSYLIGLLLIDIITAIAREPKQHAEDYDNIKQTLLKRFKLNPESFRQKFVSRQKHRTSNLKKNSFELRNYHLNKWLTGLSNNLV